MNARLGEALFEVIDDDTAVLKRLIVWGDDHGHDQVAETFYDHALEVDDGRVDVLVLDTLEAQVAPGLTRIGRALPAIVTIGSTHDEVTVMQSGAGCKGSVL